jgi:tetratricopeptide (TPR) repeat protein
MAEQLGDRESIGFSTHQLAALARNRGEYDTADELFEKSIDIFKELGFMSDYCGALRNRGDLKLKQNLFQEARELCERSLAIAKNLGYRRGIENNLQLLGEIDLSEGKINEARAKMTEAFDISQELVDARSMARSLEYLALIAEKESDFETTYRRFWQGKTIYQRIGAKHRFKSITKKYKHLGDRFSPSEIQNLENQARSELEKWSIKGVLIDDKG